MVIKKLWKKRLLVFRPSYFELSDIVSILILSKFKNQTSLIRLIFWLTKFFSRCQIAVKVTLTDQICPEVCSLTVSVSLVWQLKRVVDKQHFQNYYKELNACSHYRTTLLGNDYCGCKTVYEKHLSVQNEMF